jgi:hypothetical protein
MTVLSLLQVSASYGPRSLRPELMKSRGGDRRGLGLRELGRDSEGTLTRVEPFSFPL